MAEEVKKEGEKEVKEGTVEAEIKKTEGEVIPPKVEEKKPEAVPQTVPLAVFLDLKKDMKELQDSIKDSKKGEKSTVAIEGLEELTKKYEDVDPQFISDLLGAATESATKKVEQKYTPIIERQEAEKKQEQFDKAFDSLFEKTIKDNPELPKNIDKELVKELAITEKYRNIPLAEILTKMYGTTEGKSSSENDTRNSVDIVDDIVSFDKITADQRKAIMDDPKTRKKYFDWLDGQPQAR